MIVGMSRTPIGKFRGKLKDISEQKLAAIAMNDAIENAGIDPKELDKVILGTAKQTSMPSNCARHAMLVAELPIEVPAYTVQRQSASGTQAIANAYWDIKSNNAQAILAGGTESMSLIPLEIHDARFKFDKDTRIIFDPITAQMTGAQPIVKYNEVTIEMINENLSSIYKINKEEIEEYIDRSISKAQSSDKERRIKTIEVKKRKTVDIVDKDELYLDKAELARPADGAAVSILMSEDKAKELSLKILGEIVSFGISAGDPKSTGMVGRKAIEIALKKANIGIEEIDVIALNEMSAQQSISTCRELENLGLKNKDINLKLNPNGGALGTGNPWGAIGTVLLNDTISELNSSNKRYGLIITPAEGGQAMAMIIKGGAN